MYVRKHLSVSVCDSGVSGGSISLPLALGSSHLLLQRERGEFVWHRVHFMTFSYISITELQAVYINDHKRAAHSRKAGFLPLQAPWLFLQLFTRNVGWSVQFHERANSSSRHSSSTVPDLHVRPFSFISLRHEALKDMRLTNKLAAQMTLIIHTFWHLLRKQCLNMKKKKSFKSWTAEIFYHNTAVLVWKQKGICI